MHFNISTVLGNSYTCNPGQGEYGKSYDLSSTCSESTCQQKCDNDPQCKGFDFTSTCRSDTCRLYTLNTPRNDPGTHQRKYCVKQSKLK